MNDGGPAFPNQNQLGNPEGMPLRDFFAAAAICGLCADKRSTDSAVRVVGKEGTACEDLLARIAYARADAMLRERDNA